MKNEICNIYINCTYVLVIEVELLRLKVIFMSHLRLFISVTDKYVGIIHCFIFVLRRNTGTR